ncbi:hypothetical protein [Roseiarcus sp.]|uniref:hypothetical protein n=1 Tax=Roseiarcus sp. TaxID=1969460 RepID=UPI003F994ED5
MALRPEDLPKDPAALAEMVLAFDGENDDLVHNHFNQERHLVARAIYKQRRSAALAEWHTVMGRSSLRIPSCRA